MHPILFEFGNFRIYSYGFVIALGFIIALYLAAGEGKRRGLAAAHIFDVGLYSLLFGIMGARALHVLLNLRYYAYYPLSVIMINRGGLAIQGGLLTAFIAAYIFIKRLKMPFWKTADVMIPYVALGQAIGRIGCLLNGCCYGMPADFGIHLPGNALPVHPTQIYSSVFLVLTFIVLKMIYERKRFDGEVFISYLAVFSAGRFFIDFFRGDLHSILFGLKTSQLISVGVFLIAIVILITKRGNRG